MHVLWRTFHNGRFVHLRLLFCCSVTCSVRGVGAYGREGTGKWTLRLAIRPAGIVAFQFVQKAGTTTDDFVDLVQAANTFLVNASPGVQHTYLWDNLSSHLNARVTNAVHFAGHRCIARPPYRPADAPIEYIFNQLEQQLQKAMYTVHTDADFVREIHTAIANLGRGVGGFDSTFRHCGY